MESPGTRLTEDEVERRRSVLEEMRKVRDDEPEFLKLRAWVQEAFKSTDRTLCGFTARSMLQGQMLSKENEELVDLLNLVHKHRQYLGVDSIVSGRMKDALAKSILDSHPTDPSASVYLQVMSIKQQARKRGKDAADALHSKPNGSRAKQELIRAIWAGGTFTSRDRCAEEQCAALGMSFSSARRALRNTPDPSRHAA